MSGIILFSDPHFANRTAFGKMDSDAEFPGCNSRFHVIAKAFREAVDYAVRNTCEYIFILGDIFHDRGSIEIPVFNGVYQLFKETTGKGIRLAVYPGNHDFVDLRAMYSNKNLHSLFAFEKLANIYGNPTIVQTAYFPVAIIPYSHSSREVIDVSNTLLSRMSGDIKMLMLHHSVNGAITGPHEWVMPHRLDPEQLPEGYSHIWSGHYHRHQKVKRLWYVGAPVHHDFGERTYTPGFIHVLPDGTWKHIENITAPRFKVVETNNLNDLNGIDPKDYVSVKWKGDTSEIEKAKDGLSENCIVEIHGTSFSKARTDIDTTDPVETMINKYASAKFDDPTEVITHGVRLYKGKK